MTQRAGRALGETRQHDDRDSIDSGALGAGCLGALVQECAILDAQRSMELVQRQPDRPHLPATYRKCARKQLWANCASCTCTHCKALHVRLHGVMCCELRALHL